MTTRSPRRAQLVLLGIFAVIARRPGLLGFAKAASGTFTWSRSALITLMDELTSVFTPRPQAYRFIGVRAIFFIAFTSLLHCDFSRARMVEIAHILELHDIRGGGVYSFPTSCRPVVSFVASRRSWVDYILTACISSGATATTGGLPADGHRAEMTIILVDHRAIRRAQRPRIRENARVTFGIFIARRSCS